MLRNGDNINNYTLEKYLGKGSYGEVWLAKKKIELSDDGILVALKFLGYQPQQGKTQEDFIKQVKREVGTWIKASGHKNIVSVQDGFTYRSDTFVIVSDFAEGGDLRRWLNQNGGKSPDLATTVRMMSEILDGLAHLHSQTPDKIIHRDLKPENVLMKSGLPCITDFGVSRMSQTVTKSMAQVAATSAGTPLYMAPESFENKPAARSMDIWAAGVMLYEMLSGKYPYYAESIYALGYDVISKPPAPLLPEIPSAFREVVERALEKDVSKRFQTVEEMRGELQKALTKRDEPAQTKPILETIDDGEFQTEQEAIRLEREAAAEKERQRLAAAEKARQVKLEEAQKEAKRQEQEKRSELLQRLRKANEKARQLGRAALGEAELSEGQIGRFENEIIEAERQGEFARRKQAELLERVRVANEKAWRLRVGKLEERNLDEWGVSRFEAYIVEEEAKVKFREADEQRKKESAEKNRKSIGWVFLLGIIAVVIGLPVLALIGVGIYNFNYPTPTVISNTPANTAKPPTASNKAANTATNAGNPATFKNATGIEFVKIPSGSFQMGSPTSEKDRSDDESPQHKVTINYDVYLGKYEVTQAQWKAVMGSNPSNFKGDDLPVEQVSWNDAQEFIKKLNAKNDGYEYRLPSESEWEYAARAGTTTVFAFGDNLSSNEANFNGNYPYGNAAKGKSLGKTAPVGSYQANKFGLYDMHGNVWEWVADIYNEKGYGGLPVDGSSNVSVGDSSNRVLRGGSWNGDGLVCRSAYRNRNAPDNRDLNNGFRLAARPKTLGLPESVKVILTRVPQRVQNVFRRYWQQYPKIKRVKLFGSFGEEHFGSLFA